MAAPYSVRFVSGTVQSSADAVALRYTVPVGRRAIVRTVSFFAEATGVVFFGWFPSNHIWTSSQGVPLFDSRTWEGRQVVNAGELLGPQWVSGGKIHVVASGYLLTV